MYSERVSIYGIFENGICLYVGQTVNEWHRRDTHRKRWPKGEFRVLRRTSQANANKLEKRWIRHYQRKGQAQFNKGARGAGHSFMASPGRIVTIEGFEKPFYSAAAAARALGCSTPTFWKYYRQFGSAPFHTGPGKKIGIVENRR